MVETVADGAAVSDGAGALDGMVREIPRDDLTSMPSHAAVPADGQATPTSYRPSTALDSSLRRLNDCLRGEIAAVEAYDLALDSARDPDLHAPLRELRDSHKRRVKMLAQKVRNWNGEPAERSGAWGALARVVQRAADLFGDRAALLALAHGEEHGIARYEEDLVGLDPATREFLEAQLLPLQRESLAFCRAICVASKAA
jgi:demethoxyubiquinone hydroxylase (CLK1/Coq7/Cat5 family)